MRRAAVEVAAVVGRRRKVAVVVLLAVVLLAAARSQMPGQVALARLQVTNSPFLLDPTTQTRSLSQCRVCSSGTVAVVAGVVAAVRVEFSSGPAVAAAGVLLVVKVIVLLVEALAAVVEGLLEKLLKIVETHTRLIIMELFSERQHNALYRFTI